MRNSEQKALADFKEAKKIALDIRKCTYRRSSRYSNYCGFKNNDNRSFVIGDTIADIQNPDCYIDNKPAREVFGDFTVMSK